MPPVDPEDGLAEFLDLWSAKTADTLHYVLVLHRPVRGSADAFEAVRIAPAASQH